MNINEYVKAKQLLIDLVDWQVCRFTDADQHTELYGVHTRCRGDKDEFPPQVYNWGWILSDTVPDCAEQCFNCKAAVPPEVVALIKLLKSN